MLSLFFWLDKIIAILTKPSKLKLYNQEQQELKFVPNVTL